MASFDQLKELFMNQEVKDGKRREKEKEEEERRRKEDKEEVKELIKSQMSSIKEEIKEIKSKQDMIEDKVMKAEKKMAKKYDDMANKVGNIEKKIKGLEERKRAEEEVSDKTLSEIHSAGRTCPALQPVQPVLQPAIHPDGRQRASGQPVDQVVTSVLKPQKEGNNEYIYWIVRQSRKTVGFSPISQSDIKEVMNEMRIESIKEGLEEVIKDFLRWEMAIPEDEISKLQFARIFRREGDMNPNDDKLYVEFVEESMPAIVYKYLKKMRSRCNVLTFIPEAFRERAKVLEKAAYNLRHSNPSYSTKIRWGWGDLILERKMRGSREQYRPVHMTHLPPVDLTTTPRERLVTPTSSPAPGRRKRSQESPNLSKQDFQ